MSTLRQGEPCHCTVHEVRPHCRLSSAAASLTKSGEVFRQCKYNTEGTMPALLTFDSW